MGIGTPNRAEEEEERELVLVVGEQRSIVGERGEIGEDVKALVLCFTDLIKYCCCKKDSCC